MLKYIRGKIFLPLLRPVSVYSRKKRAELFVRKIKPEENMRILDLGGEPQIWDYIDVPMQISCLNLPGIVKNDHISHHEIIYIEGDGCSMPEFQDGQFDFIFSNSVIEHVGNYKKRKMFAEEVKRLGKNYWIQTPYKYYPIEAHCGMPFWWLYPKVLRSSIIARWRKKLPDWANSLEETDVVSVKEMKQLFPEASITMEWLIFPKSIIAISN